MTVVCRYALPMLLNCRGSIREMEYSMEMLESYDSTTHKMPAYGGRSRSISS